MAETKPTGPAAAARDIIGLTFNHRNGTKVNLRFLMQNEKQETTESIEAIILEHCPEEKAAPETARQRDELLKMVTDLISYIDECEKLGQIQPMQAKAIREVARTAIAKTEPVERKEAE